MPTRPPPYKKKTLIPRVQDAIRKNQDKLQGQQKSFNIDTIIQYHKLQEAIKQKPKIRKTTASEK